MLALMHLDPKEPSRLVGLWAPPDEGATVLRWFYPAGEQAARDDAALTLDEKVAWVSWEAFFGQLADRMPTDVWWEVTEVDDTGDLEALFVVLAAAVLASAAAIHGMVSDDSGGELAFTVRMFSAEEATRLGLEGGSMLAPLDPTLLETHHVRVGTDSPFQQRARLLQALWREDHGLSIGTRTNSTDGIPLGSRLRMPDAKDTLAGYLSDTIRRRVRREVLAPDRDRGRLFGEPRIFCDLLSSQPLAFNLFAELGADRSLATAVFQDLMPGVVGEVDHIEFEYSPGRRDVRYLGNRSAFDVFVVHTTPAGGWGFVGIEVKYHEDLKVKAASMDDRPRYQQVANRSKAFATDAHDVLGGPPLQQIWFDHLLALSMLQAGDGWDTGRFVFLAPMLNAACSAATDRYSSCLNDSATFEAWTIEALHERVGGHSDASWVHAFADRYLDFERVDALDQPT